ncbi:MAG: DUF6125 family protein [Candidatus Kariarchaeaceae archaeon]
MDLNNLSKEDLIKLVKMYAKNWLAHDGCWFQAIEQTDSMEKAIDMDKLSWERFTRIEAKRIAKEFDITIGSGLEGLRRALGYRLYAQLNEDAFSADHNKLIYKMMTCRVQAARDRKNLPHFPCKGVGIVEYSGFASTIDPRIQTRCIAAPPDSLERDYHCGWEFILNID